MQSVMMCSICREAFDESYDHIPRVLPCGHTFCTKCLGNLFALDSSSSIIRHNARTTTGSCIKCPNCRATHSIPRPDPTALPPNSAALDIIKERVTQVVGAQAPVCDSCKGCEAEIVCMACDSSQPVHFCARCDEEEHRSTFAQRHRRSPLRQTFCSVHTRDRAIYYSMRRNVFVCQMCQSVEPDDCKPIRDAAKQLRQETKEWDQSVEHVVLKCSQTQQTLTRAIDELLPASCDAAKEKVKKMFIDLAIILRLRQEQLLTRIDDEYIIRKEMFEKQMEDLEATLKNAKTCQEKLAELDRKNDEDFLRSYHLVIQEHTDDLFSTEDSDLNSLTAQYEIPVVFDDCSGTLQSLGDIGGGPTPTDLAVVPSNNCCNLFRLQWGVPPGSDVPVEFQVACQNLSGDTGSTSSLMLLNVSGKFLSCFVDNFVPGCNYQFRIRSCNKAGWGIWSPPTLEACRDFPIKIGYSRLVHKVVLPEDGAYRITAKGAKGGSIGQCKGGHGAVVSATFQLKAGDTLIILSGGKSEEHQGTSGGGGGSFVALNEREDLLLVAGGGGGARNLGGREEDGCDASLEMAGTPGHRGAKGGQDGGPGEDAYQSGIAYGYGGAGALVKSATAISFLEGGMGGQCGGFGGGGAANCSGGSPKEGGRLEPGCLFGGGGGGGGGGYSGGGGGGGGGGSFVRKDGTNVEKKVGHNDNGSIVIEKCDVDHPAGALRQESGASTGSNCSYNRAYSS